jgi:hypothetical protein
MLARYWFMRSAKADCRWVSRRWPGFAFPFPYRVAVGAVCQIVPFRFAQRLIHRPALVEIKIEEKIEGEKRRFSSIKSTTCKGGARR